MRSKFQTLVFIALSALLSYLTVSWLQDAKLADLDVYLAAAQALHRGENPYLQLGNFYLGDEPFPSFYFYPPLLVVIIEKLLWLGEPHIKHLWIYASTVSLVLGSFFLASATSKNTTLSWRHSLVLVIVFLFPPTYDGLYFGQVNSFVFLFLTCGLLAVVSNRQLTAGMALAIATALKTSPVMIIPTLLGKKWRSGFSIFLLIISLCLCLCFFSPRGGELIIDFITGTQQLASGERFFDRPGNYSFAVLLKASMPTWSSKLCSHTAQGIALLLFIVAIIKTKFENSFCRTLLYGQAVVAMILASPIIWYHHLIWLLIPHLYFLRFSHHTMSICILWFALLTAALSLPIDSYLAVVVLRQRYEYRQLLGPCMVVIPCLIYFFIGQRLKLDNPGV